MNFCNSQSQLDGRVFVTDLDGTLIPLRNDKEQLSALELITSQKNAQRFKLVFATGRQYKSVMEGIQEHDLPQPDWIICDVGSSIYLRNETSYQLLDPYHLHLGELTKGTDRDGLFQRLVDEGKLKPQEANHQQKFKLSFSCASEETEESVERTNQLLSEWNCHYTCMGSIDPFLDCGLIDVLPTGVNKAYAVNWLMDQMEGKDQDIVYAGDSGNDYAALVHGFKSIVVANASKGLAPKVRQALEEQGHTERFFLADKESTAGVAQGLTHYGFIKP